MPRCKYTVHYGSETARFSDEADARDFGRFMSFRIRALVEMSDKTGLIGQWRNGKSTPEFADR